MEPIKILELGRGPTLAGSRITVYDIMPFYLKGYTADYIAECFEISTPEVEVLIRYIEEHRDAVMAVHQKIEERIARGNPPEIEEKLKHSHAKLLARRTELEKRAREVNGEGNPGGHQHSRAGEDSRAHP